MLLDGSDDPWPVVLTSFCCYSFNAGVCRCCWRRLTAWRAMFVSKTCSLATCRRESSRWPNTSAPTSTSRSRAISRTSRGLPWSSQMCQVQDALFGRDGRETFVAKFDVCVVSKGDYVNQGAMSARPKNGTSAECNLYIII